MTDFLKSALPRGVVYICLAIALGLGMLLGSSASWIQNIIPMPCEKNFALLNPSNRCSNKTGGEWSYETLRTQLLNAIQGLQKGKSVTHVAIYFRELDNGPRFGIGEYDSFYPASLLKVPVMMAVLHAADRDPSILDQKLSFSGSIQDIHNVEEPDQTIAPHTFYTVKELLRRMIVYSDNYSKDLLIERLRVIPGGTAENAYLDLGILPVMQGTTGTISIQSYSYLFAVLFNSGYLSNNMSQYALNLLSQSTYNDGLVAGVPDGTLVAHKFGIRAGLGGEQELHDCGIVYHPTTAYVLCVMTSGKSIDENARAISTISHIVFDGVSTLNHGS